MSLSVIPMSLTLTGKLSQYRQQCNFAFKTLSIICLLSVFTYDRSYGQNSASENVEADKSSSPQDSGIEKDEGKEEIEVESIQDDFGTKYKPKSPKTLPLKEGIALVIPISGTIDLGLPPYIKRALQEHPEAETIILEIDTLGGRVDAAILIRDLLLSEERTTIAYIYRRAISAGALISFAADYIVFSPGSTMGAATPIQLDNGKATAVGEKMVSYFRSEMRATAEANGRDGDIAEAMVDADKVVPSVSVKGKLLTLTNRSAAQLGLANAVVDSPSALYRELGINEGKLIRAEESWSETVARAVTEPTLSGLLMSVGMLGIMIELYTPGIGFAGLLGFFSLLTFFIGHKVAGLAGSEELILIILGLILLAAELFVIPGFGVAGVLGILSLAVGLIASMGELPEGQLWDYGRFEEPTQVFVYSLVLSMILLAILAKYLPKSRFGSWLVLTEELGADSRLEGTHEPLTAIHPELKIGQQGVTTTPLRLSGKAKFDEKVFDIISRDEYLEPQQLVEIVECARNRVVVVAVRDS